MMAPALALAAANLLLIATLPRFFFRRGRLNAAWWLTATPFVLAGAGTCAAAAGLLDPPPMPAALGILSLLLSSASVMLICYAAGSHGHPVSLWHQEDDTPARLVTLGAYARVRHPFYTAFLTTLAACLLAAPSALTAIAATLGALQLTRTARREERRLLAAFGDEYARYMRRTGRFVPRF
jgi:protein-S-isoprenylcysteine O-methyltransferase Ste14